MLKISEDSLGRSQFIDYMLYLFQVTSEPTYPTTIHIPTPEFNEYIEILYSRNDQQLPEIIVDNNIPTINIPDDPNHVVLAFSGGKDSVAHAAFLKDHNFNPTLYFVRHMNRAYPNELNVAHDIANLLDCPLIEDHLSYSGKVAKAESPVKNHLILSLIIDYMRQNNLTRCACGTYIEDNLDKTPTQFGLSDAYEFYLAFMKGVKSFFPNFKWLCWFQSEFHAISYLVHTHPDLIPHYQSCLLPDRYRKNVHNANARKFNIEPMPNRCLSCWKCAQEYLILSDLNYLPKPSDELFNHFLEVFKKDLPKVMSEEQLAIVQTKQETIPELLDHFITEGDNEIYGTLEQVMEHIDMEVFK